VRSPDAFDPLLANLLVRGSDRAMCINRLRRALMEFRIVGVQTNVALHKQIVQHPTFLSGKYDTSFMAHFHFDMSTAVNQEACRDLVAMTAVTYLLRRRVDEPVVPERVKSGWHRSARRLPS
jgi:acetyl/propionyl-CoA carboxylase alpha subunit